MDGRSDPANPVYSSLMSDLHASPGRLSRLAAGSRRVPPAASLATALLITALVVAGDLSRTGPTLIFPLAYWIPLTILAWFQGRRWATPAALAMAVISFASLVVSSDGTPVATSSIISRGLLFAGAFVMVRVVSAARAMVGFWEHRGEIMSGLTPFRLGSRFVIVPTPDEDQPPTAVPAGPNDVRLALGPTHGAFGNGTHLTTELCLSLLEEALLPGQTVFDVGSGTGILAIAAAKLGARRVLAVDIDRRAEQAIAHNLRLNKVEGTVQFRLGSWRAFKDPEWENAGGRPEAADLILANLLTPIIIKALGDGLADHLAKGGKMILSGVRFDQVDQLQPALAAAGLQIIESRRLREWTAHVVARRV